MSSACSSPRACIAGFAGCVLAAKLRIGQANVGLDYLLPALVGAFLGSTTIKPGRVNVWGTMFGVLILAVGISGIQQLGGAFFVEPLFNGTTLVVAIALAAFAQRRRTVVETGARRDSSQRGMAARLAYNANAAKVASTACPSRRSRPEATGLSSQGATA